MSRIEPIKDFEESELSPLFAQAEKWMGFQPNDGLLMGHKPEILISFFGLAKAIYAEDLVPSGLKRMIGHITSLAAGCGYCSAHTAYGADKHGVSKDKLEAIWEFQTSPLFSESERAALNVALKAGMKPNAVTDEDFENLKAHFSKPAIVEIVGVISMFGFLNSWNATLNTQIENEPDSFYQSLKKNT
ncbi:carboxymuconolactone decarboxylase family protein [Maribacter sp.]|nr:carboxymuconolactone decarboxylase family protein [Maribacter sp.]